MIKNAESWSTAVCFYEHCSQYYWQSQQVDKLSMSPPQSTNPTHTPTPGPTNSLCPLSCLPCLQGDISPWSSILEIKKIYLNNSWLLFFSLLIALILFSCVTICASITRLNMEYSSHIWTGAVQSLFSRLDRIQKVLNGLVDDELFFYLTALFPWTKHC